MWQTKFEQPSKTEGHQSDLRSSCQANGLKSIYNNNSCEAVKSWLCWMISITPVHQSTDDGFKRQRRKTYCRSNLCTAQTLIARFVYWRRQEKYWKWRKLCSYVSFVTVLSSAQSTLTGKWHRITPCHGYSQRKLFSINHIKVNIAWN